MLCANEARGRENGMPRVTVCLTSYNHAPYLRESIESILTQTYQDFSLVIIDDCSQDDSWEIIQSYRDSRIRARRNEKNTNCTYLPEVLREFSAPYTAIAHSDDKWMPDKLEKQVAYLDAHPEMAACFTLVNVIDEGGKIYQDSQNPYCGIFNQKNRSRTEWLRYFFEHDNCLCHPSLLIRQRAFEDYGLLAKGLYGLPDFHEWVKLAGSASFHIIPERLTCFRIHNDASNTSAGTDANLYRHEVEKYQAILPLYLELRKEDFLQVFPEAAGYDKSGGYVQAFAYAQILLQNKKNYVHYLYGLDLIYGLLQDDEKAKTLETLYRYGPGDFNRQKRQSDVFGCMREIRKFTASLYYDEGTGFSEDRKILGVISPDKSIQEISFSLPENVQTIQGLRFDPVEGFFCRVRVTGLWQSSGKAAVIEPLNAADVENGLCCFFTEDPIFNVSVPVPLERVLKLTVSLTLVRDGEIYETFKQSQDRLIAQLRQAKAAIPERESELQRAFAQKQEKSLQREQKMQMQNAQLECQRDAAVETAQVLQKELFELKDYLNHHRFKTLIKCMIRWKF